MLTHLPDAVLTLQSLSPAWRVPPIRTTETARIWWWWLAPALLPCTPAPKVCVGLETRCYACRLLLRQDVVAPLQMLLGFWVPWCWVPAGVGVLCDGTGGPAEQLRSDGMTGPSRPAPSWPPGPFQPLGLCANSRQHHGAAPPVSSYFPGQATTPEQALYSCAWCRRTLWDLRPPRECRSIP